MARTSNLARCLSGLSGLDELRMMRMRRTLTPIETTEVILVGQIPMTPNSWPKSIRLGGGGAKTGGIEAFGEDAASSIVRDVCLAFIMISLRLFMSELNVYRDAPVSGFDIHEIREPKNEPSLFPCSCLSTRSRRRDDENI